MFGFSALFVRGFHAVVVVLLDRLCSRCLLG